MQPSRVRQDNQTADTLTDIYLPLVQVSMQGVRITSQGGVVRSSDDRIIVTVPAGAVAEDVWISLRTGGSHPPIEPTRDLGVIFNLTAINARGTTISQFNKPLTLDVPYTPRAGQTSTQVGVYFFDERATIWQELPTIEVTAGQLQATTDHFTDFGVLMANSWPVDGCPEDLAPGQGSPHKDRFASLYDSLGGKDKIGCPTGPASDASGTWWQEFSKNGTVSAIIYNADKATPFYLAPDYLAGYKQAGGFAKLGVPVEHSPTSGKGPDHYFDANNDFRATPIQNFRYGFVGNNKTTWTGGYHFPLVCPVNAAITDYVKQPTAAEEQAGVKATRTVTLTVSFTGNPAPGAPSGKASFTSPSLALSINGTVEPVATLNSEGTTFKYVKELAPRPATDPLPKFAFTITAGRSGDTFTGYAPIDTLTTNNPIYIPEYGGTSRTIPCPGGLGDDGVYTPPADTTPPTIAKPKVTQDGFGGVEIITTITDNTSVAGATAYIKAKPYLMKSLGGDKYSVFVSGLPVERYPLFILATDLAGNVGRWPATGAEDFEIEYSGVYGEVKWVGYSEDPVNTLIGNFIYKYTDLTIAEPGPDLELLRFYNAQSNTVGRFGLGWSTVLDMRLTMLEGSQLTGAMVRYADGRTARFPADGSGFGRAPFGFDTLAREGLGYVLTTTDQTRYAFDKDGRLVRVEDLSGNALILSYNGDALSSITAPSGRSLTFTSDGKSRITGIQAPEGVSLAYTYDNNGRLLSVKDGNGKAVTYGYDKDNGLTKLTTPAGHDFVQDQQYDNRGRIVYQRVGDNFINRFVYDDANRTTVVTDTYGRTTTHRYDEKGRIVEQTDALGKTEYFTYNDDNQITSHTDRNGNTTTYEYLDGNKVKEIDARNGVWTWTYDAGRRVTSETDPLGHVTGYEYDTKGQQTAIIDALAQRTELRYNDAGQVIERRRPRGDVTRFAYDDQGNLKSETDALGNVTRYEYDAQGRKVKQIDALGGVWTWTYDANGNVLTETDPLKHTTTSTYDANNGRASETDANGNTTRYTYSTLGKLLTTKHADGGVTTIAYNDLGHRVAEIDPLNQTRRWELDPLYRVAKAIDPTGAVTSYAYDANGNQTAITDPRGFTTKIEYDALNREVRRIDPLGGVTETSYDAVGNRTKVKAPNGAITTYVYDALNRVVQVIDAIGNVTKTSYDAAGNVTTEIDALGGTTFHTYDLLGRKVETKDALDNVTRTEYDALDRVVTVTDANGAVTRTKYDAAGQTISTTDALSGVTKTAYDAVGNTSVVTDALGFATTTVYNAMNRPVAVTDALGGVTRTKYDLAGRRVATTDANNNITTYAYDPAGRTVLVTDPLGFTVASDYDLAGNLIATTDQEGATTRFEYDALNRKVKQINALGFATMFAYDSVGNLITTTDAKGVVSFTSYDLLDQVVAETNALGYVTKHTYDALGQRISTMDANGVVTTRAYDALGRVTSETDGEGFTRSFKYDAVGNQVSVTDARGNTTMTTFDLLRRPVEQRDSIGLIQGMTYDAVGNVVVMTGGNGHTTTTVYNALRCQVRVTDAEDNTSVVTYDAVGNVVAETDGNGHTTRHTYDARNQRVATTDPRGYTTKFSYDKVGRPLMITDALGVMTRNRYDAVGQLIAVTLNYNASELANAWTNVTTRYTYDSVGNRVSITDPKGAVITFTPDALGQLVAEKDPLGNKTVYIYDPVGSQVERREPNGNVVKTTFDRNRRPVTITYDDGTKVEKHYDGNSNLVELHDSSGVTTFAYDVRNRKTGETTSYGTVTFVYDGANNEAAVTYPDGRVLRKAYYRNNWLQTVITPVGSVARYAYDGIGQVVRLDGGDGTLTTQSYDAANNLLRIEKRKVGPNGKLLVGITYVYDAINQRTQATNDYRDGQPRTVTETYTQDRLQRLTELRDSAGVVVSYTYDAAGNRTSWTGNDDPRTSKPFDDFNLAFTYDAADQLTHMQDTSARTTVEYGYDASGNRIERQSDREAVIYAYDNENRLASVQEYQVVGGGKWNKHELTTMDYDGIGRRVAKTVDNQAGGGAKTRIYAFAGLDPLSYTETWNGQHINLYRAQSGRILAQDRYAGGDNGQQLWLTQDGLGSTVALATDNGQTAKNYRYDPYGVTDEREFDSATHIDFLFTGQENDASTGLHHFYARDYDPETGTWLTRDPYRGTPNDPQSLHRYGYVKGNPVNLWDMLGYQSSDGPDGGTFAYVSSLQVFKYTTNWIGRGITETCSWWGIYCTTSVENPAMTKVATASILYDLIVTDDRVSLANKPSNVEDISRKTVYGGVRTDWPWNGYSKQVTWAEWKTEGWVQNRQYRQGNRYGIVLGYKVTGTIGTITLTQEASTWTFSSEVGISGGKKAEAGVSGGAELKMPTGPSESITSSGLTVTFTTEFLLLPIGDGDYTLEKYIYTEPKSFDYEGRYLQMTKKYHPSLSGEQD